MNPALWSELEGWAQDELRSVNGQIEYLLKQAVRKRRNMQETDGETKESTDSANS